MPRPFTESSDEEQLLLEQCLRSAIQPPVFRTACGLGSAIISRVQRDAVAFYIWRFFKQNGRLPAGTHAVEVTCGTGDGFDIAPPPGMAATMKVSIKVTFAGPANRSGKD